MRQLSWIRSRLAVAIALVVVGVAAAVVPQANSGALAGSPPTNATPPTVTGGTAQGQTLTADPGTWNGASMRATSRP
jgi:hypothetical protein